MPDRKRRGTTGNSTRSQHAQDPENAQKADIGRFDNVKIFSYGGVLGVFAFTASINGFGDMWSADIIRADPTMFTARAALFAASLGLMVRWIVATLCEFEMWILWLEHPAQRSEVYSAIVTLSIILGVTLAFPHKVVVITAFIGVAYLLNYWTQWLTNSHFRRALLLTRNQAPSEVRRKVLKVMEHYWLELPQLGRLATMMFFGCGAFALAFAGAFQAESARRQFDLWAYGVATADLVVGEIIISRWRIKRDAAIKNIVET